MGQKSISTLCKIDSSMTWESHIFNKNYKWLSYNLWFAYIHFYKTIFFLKNILIINQNLNITTNSFLILNYKKFVVLEKEHIRFCYYIDLYCIEFFNYILLLNLFFKTNLSFFKDVRKFKKKKKRDFFN